MSTGYYVIRDRQADTHTALVQDRWTTTEERMFRVMIARITLPIPISNPMDCNEWVSHADCASMGAPVP